jgi:hypothetical protein
MDGMYRRRSWMAFGFHSSLVTSSSILELCFCFSNSDADISIAESASDHLSGLSVTTRKGLEENNPES